MAEEPDNLVLKMLREMREALQDVRAKVYEHDGRFDDLRKTIEDWKETTATGVGFAAHANIRTEALEKEIAELKRRIDRLERAH
jgi:predicted  nucleic acid-binding Zn-ribbon protein